ASIVSMSARTGAVSRAGFRSSRLFFFFSSRRRHTRSKRDWSSDVCSSDLSLESFSIISGQLLLAQGRVHSWRGTRPSVLWNSREIGRASCREGGLGWGGGGCVNRKREGGGGEARAGRESA